MSFDIPTPKLEIGKEYVVSGTWKGQGGNAIYLGGGKTPNMRYHIFKGTDTKAYYFFFREYIEEREGILGHHLICEYRSKTLTKERSFPNEDDKTKLIHMLEEIGEEIDL